MKRHNKRNRPKEATNVEPEPQALAYSPKGGDEMSPIPKTAVEAESLSEMVDILGGEEQALAILKAALKHKEQQRLSHKMAYLKRQLILQRAKEAGITGEGD
jgi:predicted RNA-binding protein with EMAP domain